MKLIKLICFFCLAFGTIFSEDISSHIKFSETEENLIGYLHVEKDRSIDLSTYIQMKFAIEDFKKKGVRFIILHLDTPGGEVLAATKITDLLHEVDLKDHIPVVAVIDNWAISAGAMLAYSCRFIGTNKSSIMGAAEPVLMGSDGKMESASEKMTSALSAQMASLASYYNRDPLIAKAMVDKDLVIVKRGESILELSNEGEIKQSDQVISKAGKLLTLTSKEIVDYGISDILLKTHAKESITSSFSFEQLSLAKAPFFDSIPYATVITYTDWKVQFFSILSHPMIASLLVMGMMIGFYIEINSAGFGIAGSIALCCLSLVLLNSFAIYAINILELIILVCGIILLLIELFIIPGFGVTGIIGICLILIGTFVLMLPGIDLFHLDSLQIGSEAILERGVYFSLAIILSMVVILVLARYVTPKFYRYAKIVLTGEQESKDGYIAGPTEFPKIGSAGVTFTELRPFGKILVEGNLYSATADGKFMEKGAAIIVTAIDGNKVIVTRGKS